MREGPGLGLLAAHHDSQSSTEAARQRVHDAAGEAQADDEFVQQDRPARHKGGLLLGVTHQKEQGRRNNTGAVQTAHPQPIRLRKLLETDVLPTEMRQRANADWSASARTEDPGPDQGDDRVKCNGRGAAFSQRGVESRVIDKRVTIVQDPNERRRMDRLIEADSRRNLQSMISQGHENPSL